MLGLQAALVGDDVPAAVGARLQLGDAGLEIDLGAGDPRRFGIGMGRAGRIEIAVGRIQHGADEILLLEQRQQLLGFFGGQQFGFEAEIAGAAMGHLQPFHALRRISQHQPAGAVQAAGLAGDLLQLVIEADGIALELGDIRIAVQGVEAAGGMPGRAGGELVALQQHDIAPPRLGEVIEHAATHHAAADDGHLNMRFHCRLLS